MTNKNHFLPLNLDLAPRRLLPAVEPKTGTNAGAGGDKNKRSLWQVGSTEDVCKDPTAEDQQKVTVWLSWFRGREDEEMSFTVS